MLISLFVCSSSFAGHIDNDEALGFAGFILDIVQQAHTSSQNTAICILGSDEISRIISNQSKDFIDLNSDPKRYLHCKAVYFAMNRQKGLGTEIDKYNNSKILTIAVFDGFNEMGGMVQIQTGRRTLEVILNSKELKAAGVRLSALAMSFVIN